jgi:hypothetical protein
VIKTWVLSVLTLCLLAAAAAAGPPPPEPPNPPPATVLPDLRGTWKGYSYDATDNGFTSATFTVKVTEKGKNGLYRGWVTSVRGGVSSTSSWTGRFDSENRLSVNDGFALIRLRFDLHPTTNTSVFPSGWQPVLTGNTTRVDDGTASPDSSSSGYLFLQKTTP